MEAWKLISQEPRAPQGVLTDEFVKKFDQHIDWFELSKRYFFTLDMLRTYFHRVDWCPILRRQQFSMEFLKEMHANFDDCSWEVLSKHQKLSEDFMREFKDHVYWDVIAERSDVAKAFVDTNYQPDTSTWASSGASYV